MKQRGTQAPGAMRVQEVLPPAPLHDLRDQHGDQLIGMLIPESPDQLEQRRIDPAERRLKQQELGRRKPGGRPPQPIVPPPPLEPAGEAFGLWLLLRSSASGCTAMTGVEAVSISVDAFREPMVKEAHRTLTAIVAILGMLLAGIVYLALVEAQGRYTHHGPDMADRGLAIGERPAEEQAEQCYMQSPEHHIGRTADAADRMPAADRTAAPRVVSAGVERSHAWNGAVGAVLHG